MKDIVLFIWMLLFLIGLLLLYRFYLLIRSIRLEKKLSHYTIDSLENNNITLFEQIEIIYGKLLIHITSFLKKIKLFNNYSKKYDHYRLTHHKDGFTVVGIKLLTGITFLILVFLISFLVDASYITFKCFIAFVVGFYLFDIYYYLKKKRDMKRIEEDLVKVLTIMNHSFQSGNSIMQAISIVASEIDGPLKKEFKKMSMDLSFGLDLETTFERFYERVPLEDVKYLTNSLIVFNQTGGNIVTIFKMIEKNFYTRKQLNQELKATTSSAKLIFQILVAMPIFMILIITVFNSTYFNVLFTTPIGIFISILILLLYIGYILIIRKIMKIEYR